MSFGWWCEDKAGNDLFEEFGVHYQALGLGGNGSKDDGETHSVGDIRAVWIGVPYKEKFEDAARDAVASVQAMAAENKESLRVKPHCQTCACEGINGYRKPAWWSVEAIDKLLAVPLDRVWRAGGGY